MIFVTVGTTWAFDDLVKEIDRIAPELDDEVLIQIGNGKYRPKNCKYFRFAPDLNRYFKEADMIISHGGAGTIFEVLNHKKKLVGVDNPEVPDSHQPDILRRLSDDNHLVWCKDLDDLKESIDEAKKKRLVPYKQPKFEIPEKIKEFAERIDKSQKPNSTPARLKNIIIRSILVLIFLYIPHFFKNLIVSMYRLEPLINMPPELRVFNKIIALKVLVVVGIFFLIYNRKKLLDIPLEKVNEYKSFGMIISSYLIMLYYYGSQLFINYNGLYDGILPITIVITQFIALGLYAALIIIAIFGWDYLMTIRKRLHPQPYVAFFAWIILIIALIQFEKAWPIFSFMVSQALNFMLSIFFPMILIMDGNTPIIIIDNFAVSIGAPCSGIDSMLFFIVFFAGLFALDRKLLRKRRFFIFGAIGLLGVILLNIIRLFLLILVGVYISKELAVGMFHTNAAWILFVLYFFVYYAIIRRYIYKKEGKDV